MARSPDRSFLLIALCSVRSFRLRNCLHLRRFWGKAGGEFERLEWGVWVDIQAVLWIPNKIVWDPNNITILQYKRLKYIYNYIYTYYEYSIITLSVFICNHRIWLALWPSIQYWPPLWLNMRRPKKGSGLLTSGSLWQQILCVFVQPNKYIVILVPIESAEGQKCSVIHTQLLRRLLQILWLIHEDPWSLPFTTNRVKMQRRPSKQPPVVFRSSFLAKRMGRAPHRDVTIEEGSSSSRRQDCMFRTNT